MSFAKNERNSVWVHRAGQSRKDQEIPQKPKVYIKCCKGPLRRNTYTYIKTEREGKREGSLDHALL